MTVPRVFSTLSAVVIGILAAATVCVLAVFLVIQLWQPQSLAGFLPRERTAILLQNPTENDLQTLGILFPQLRTIPPLPASVDVALVHGQTELFWIASARSSQEPLPSSNMHIGRQEFLSSDPTIALAVLQAKAPRLRSSPDFVALWQISGNARAVYLAMPNPGDILPPTVHTILQAIAPVRGPVVLSTGSGGMARLRLRSNPSPMPGAEASLPSLTPLPDLSISLGDPDRLWKAVLEGKNADERAILQGRLSAELQTLLTSDWSLQYDILPLLQHLSQLHLRWNTNGTGAALSFLVETQIPDRTLSANRLQALHKEFRTRLSVSVSDKRTLEEGLTVSVLRSDPSQVEDSTVTVGDWTVRTTQQQSGGRILQSAVRGRTVIVSNTPAWMTQRIEEGLTTLPVRGRLLAGGRIRTGLLSEWTDGASALPLWMLLTGSVQKPGDIRWTAEEAGGVMTLAIFP